jgi:hypothetical protein
MGRISLLDRFKNWVSSIGWRMFIWGLGKSENEYWNDIYEQEKLFRENSNDEED